MVEKFFKAIQAKQIGILMSIMMCFLIVVLASWLYAFWSNGLYGTKFELASCWQGLGGIVAGLGGVAALAGTQYAKYYLDSKYNSADGEKPIK